MSNISYVTTNEKQTRITTVTWIVPDFLDHFNDNSIKELRTDQIKDDADEDSDSRFQLKFLFKGKCNSIVEIYFLSPKPVFVAYKLSIFTSYRQCLNEHQQTELGYHVVHANTWQYAHMFLKENQCNYLINNSIRIKFVFKETHDIKITNVVPKTQLSNDFETLLKSGLYSDVTLKSADGKEYKVHKVVLVTRSEVLKPYFEHNTTECITNVIDSPFESEVLWEVITFLYSDKSPKINEMPEMLLAAADYYQLNGLKSLCEEALNMKLNVENAMEILELADKYSATSLKQWTLEYIKNGQARIITKTEGWSKLTSGHIFKMIYEYIMDNLDDDGLCSQKQYEIIDTVPEMD